MALTRTPRRANRNEPRVPRVRSELLIEVVVRERNHVPCSSNSMAWKRGGGQRGVAKGLESRLCSALRTK